MMLKSYNTKRNRDWIAGTAAICTPLLIFFGATRWPPSGTALAFAVLAATWAALAGLALHARATAAPYALGCVATLTVSIGTWVAGGEVMVLAFPTIMCWIFAVPFASSLRSGQTPLITRFAVVVRRHQGIEAELPPVARLHCLRFTIVWSAFLVLNGGVAALLAVAASREVWATYSCVISYFLMGLIVLSERLLRPASHA